MAVSFATPPSASLYGEHGIIATNAPSLAQRRFQGDRFWREADTDIGDCGFGRYNLK
jgi:hypothetical protein